VDEEGLTHQIISCAMQVHTTLGPGLLESAYEACLAYELSLNQIRFAKQVECPVTYGRLKIDAGYRVDILVDNKVIVELKSVERINALHQAQLLTYLKLTGMHIGLLINFNVLHLREGIKRMVNHK
jgi:GxxExxY protein